jgi:hypothetical protein
MSPTLENHARKGTDTALEAAGWVVQARAEIRRWTAASASTSGEEAPAPSEKWEWTWRWGSIQKSIPE